MTAPLYLRCIGLISPVGFSPETAVAAMRAGIDAFGDLPYVDNTGEPIVGAAVPGLAPELRGRRRIIELLTFALSEASDRIPSDFQAELPLILCTREQDRPGPNLKDVLPEIEGRLKYPFKRGSVHLSLGSVGTFNALDLISRMNYGTESEVYLVAAVDTFVDAPALDWLDRTKRLKKDGHSDGVIPGEAACVGLVSRRRMSPSDVAVRGLGFGLEEATVLNDEPCLGRGMASAVRDALNGAGIGMEEVAFRFSDVAGESYAFEEVVVAQARNLRTSRECQDLLHPAGSIGDCGAASGLIQLAWAEQAFARGYACGPVALGHCSVPSGARAAAVVSSEIA